MPTTQSEHLLFPAIPLAQYHSFQNPKSHFLPTHNVKIRILCLDTTVVESIAANGTVRFWDLHPDLAQPWRIITCCFLDTNNSNLIFYSVEQVKEGIKIYPEFTGNTSILNTSAGGVPLNNFTTNAINEFSSLSDRQPAYRIVIRSTKSLKI